MTTEFSLFTTSTLMTASATSVAASILRTIDEQPTMGAGGVVSRVAISVVRRFTIVTGEPRHRAFPGAVRLSSGEILVTYREGSDHWKTSDAVAKVVRSGDGAETWSSPELLFSEPGWGCSAHHGPAQLSDGRLIVPVLLIAEIHLSAEGQRRATDSMSAKAYVLGSEDGGRSWTGPTQIGPMEGWFWQNTYGRVRELPDGRVFIPGGGQKLGEEPWYSGYFVSHDGGRTFPDRDRVTVAHALADEIDLAPLPNGRWIAMVRDLRPPHYLHRSYSEDDGRTWSSPVISGVLGHCPSLLVLPSGTILLGAPAGRSGQAWRVCVVCVDRQWSKLAARERHLCCAQRHKGLLISEHGSTGRRPCILFLLHRVCRR